MCVCVCERERGGGRWVGEWVSGEKVNYRNYSNLMRANS